MVVFSYILFLLVLFCCSCFVVVCFVCCCCCFVPFGLYFGLVCVTFVVGRTPLNSFSSWRSVAVPGLPLTSHSSTSCGGTVAER